MEKDGIISSLVAAGLGLIDRSRLPKVNGQNPIDGLNAPVEVFTDRWGVPHIYASNLPDLYRVQGYVHASERLWQMDFNRRLVAGRLSEVIGPETVPVDRWMRILGMRRTAEQEPALLDPESSQLLEAYCSGVNTYIQSGPRSVEFLLLGYQPEPWTPVDTCTWVKMMSWSLSVNWETELLRARLIDLLGPDVAAQLELDYPANSPCILPADVDFSQVGLNALKRAAESRPYTGPGAGSGLGSNNWVIDGQRTVSGKPLLANDMHLMLSVPAIWFENHLSAPDMNVTGVTFPGIPGVVAGHNEHIAWGFTAGFPDVQDLFIEHLRKTDNGGLEVEFQGEWKLATVLKEEVRVKGKQPVVEEVVITRHGPIINSLAPDLSGEAPLALRWTSHEPDDMIGAVFRLNRAKNYMEYRQALSSWTAPIQNTVYADVEGNIAYDYQGKVPMRAKGDGSVPVPGWTGEYEWIGYIPRDELPHLFNPAQGYVASANARVTADNYPYFISRDYCTDDRLRRIRELIEAQPKIDLAYIQRMQFDQIRLSSRDIASVLGKLEVRDDPEIAAVCERMRQWDGSLSANRPEAAIFEVFIRRMESELLQPRLGELTVRYMGLGPTRVLAEGSMFGQRAQEWLQYVLSDPDSDWFGNGNGDREQRIKKVLRESLDFIKAGQGDNPDHWSWGGIHQLELTHTMGRVSALSKFFNRGPFRLGGDHNTIWATGSSMFDLRNDVIVGPPFRAIYDLADWSRSVGLLMPGNSGHPSSRHYADQTEAWFNKGYHPLLFDRKSVEKESEGRLVLVP